MIKYIKYFSYLIKHKYYVFVAGLKINASLYRLIIHDWSKFLPSEFIPYSNYFYGNHIEKNDLKRFYMLFGYPCPKRWTKEYWDEKFDFAWNYHQKRNKHHYQYWILKEDSGAIKYLDIPEKYIKEMVADWAGAGKAKTGKWEIKSWYEINKYNILINLNTRLKIERLLEQF